MKNKIKTWLKRLLFDLLKDDIRGLIIQEVCHLDPPTTIKEGVWEVKIPERPRATDCRFGPHRTIPGSLEVHYFSGARECKKTCIPCPPAGVDTKEYLLGRPEALL